MKKFIEALRNKEVDLENISLPFVPMNKSVSTNPLILMGITGGSPPAARRGAGRLASGLSQSGSGGSKKRKVKR